MTMDKENNKLIDRYLGDGEAEFDRILAEREWNRNRRIIRWTVGLGAACAAAVALLLRIIPTHQAAETPLTPIQIAEGIQQLMLLEIGDIDSIVATPKGSHAILTARLKDGSTCSFLLKCNDAEGTTTLIAYTENQ
jgi:hypothetical protein